MYIRKIYKKYIHRHIEKIKWYSIALIITIILLINSFHNKINSKITKIIIYGILTSLCVILLLYTKIGKKYCNFIENSRKELKNITWPSSIDSLKTTVIVIIITALLSLILWVLDNFLMYLISWIVHLRL